MKNTAIALLFALGSGLTLNVAQAEPFNERSVIVDTAQSNAANEPTIDVSGYNFNDRSQEFTVVEPAGAEQPAVKPMVTHTYLIKTFGNS